MRSSKVSLWICLILGGAALCAVLLWYYSHALEANKKPLTQQTAAPTQNSAAIDQTDPKAITIKYDQLPQEIKSDIGDRMSEAIANAYATYVNDFCMKYNIKDKREAKLLFATPDIERLMAHSNKETISIMSISVIKPIRKETIESPFITNSFECPFPDPSLTIEYICLEGNVIDSIAFIKLIQIIDGKLKKKSVTTLYYNVKKGEWEKLPKEKQ